MVPKGPAHEKEPDIEWWDQVILDSQDYTDWKIRDGAITSLIEHPIQVMEEKAPTLNVECRVCTVYILFYGKLLLKKILPIKLHTLINRKCAISIYLINQNGLDLKKML